MGILSGKDLLSGKYTTAIITDSDSQVHFVPIKHTLGDWFIVEIATKIFAFTLKNARYAIYRKAGAKSFKIIQYDTSNTRSLKPETKELELVLKKNALPRMNQMLFNILRLLGRKEKDNFQNHNLKELTDELTLREEQYPEEVRNIKTFLESLDIDEIVTPVRKVTDFIWDDIIAEDPGFLGEMVPRLQRLDNEHKLTSNKPVGPKIAWMKFALIAMIAILIIVVIWYGYDEGWFKTFTDLGKSFENVKLPPIGQFTPSGVKDDKYYQENFTPQSLKAAVDRGEIDYDSLPPATQKVIDNVQLPQVTP